MEKTITIQNKELKLKSSLFTIISYKNTFGTELFSDISILDHVASKSDLSQLSTLLDVIFRITYILHKPFSKETYDEFLQGFDFNVLSDTRELETIANTIAELLGTVKGETPLKK